MASIDWSAVQVVALDAVGTVIYPRPSVVSVYHQAGQAAGSQRTLNEVADRFQQAVSVVFGAAPAKTSEEAERARWHAVVRFVFDDLASVDQVLETLWLHFAQAEHWPLFDDVQPFLDRLTNWRGRTVIASNFDERLAAIGQTAFPALEVVTSSSLGVCKPATEFFLRLAMHLDVEPAEILMIGDDLRNDYRGALAAGLQALWLDRAGALDSSVPTDRTLADLDGLNPPEG